MAEEQQKLRLNGLINAESDAALFEALAPVDKHRRMGRLRQLALLGLMVERGGAVPTTPFLAAPRERPAREKRAVEAPTAPLQEPSTTRVETAIAENAPNVAENISGKRGKMNLALLGKINTSIME